MANEAEESKGETLKLSSSFVHRGFTLLGWTYPFFGLVFIVLYSTTCWFAANLLSWGIPVVVICVLLTHFLLIWGESNEACQWLRFWKQGYPILLYRRWLELDENAICCGRRQIGWVALDEAELTLLGNLIFKSRKVCGPPQIKAGKDLNPAQTILRVPWTAANSLMQFRLCQEVRQKSPNAVFNSRLQKFMKGQEEAKSKEKFSQILGLGVFLIAYVLIDLGYSTFYYLEIQKAYFLSQQAALQHNFVRSKKYFARAEQIEASILPISWVCRKFAQTNTIASTLWQAKAKALWSQGRHQESLAAAMEAIHKTPHSLRLHLYLARLHIEAGNENLAKEQIAKAISVDEQALSPRLYLIALLLSKGDRRTALQIYNDYAKTLADKVFEPEPVWPVGGERFIHDLWYQNDLRFVFEHLLKSQPSCLVR